MPFVARGKLLLDRRRDLAFYSSLGDELTCLCLKPNPPKCPFQPRVKKERVVFAVDPKTSPPRRGEESKLICDYFCNLPTSSLLHKDLSRSKNTHR